MLTTVALAVLGSSLLLPGRGRAAHAARIGGTSLRRLQLLAAGAVVAALFAAFDVPAAAVASAALAPLAATVVRWLHAHGRRRADFGSARQTPLTLSLIAAALRAGSPLVSAIELAAPTADAAVGDRLATVVGLLRLGASAEQAWLDDPDDATWTSIAAVARRSANSGTRAAASFDALATQLRVQRQADSAARAERAAVYAVVPLGLCFLPAFVCVGVLPVVIGICRGLGLPTG